MTNSIAATDIETFPDIELARALDDDLNNKTDQEVISWIGENKGREGFPKQLFHRVISQSWGVWSDTGFKIVRLGTMTDTGRDEQSIITDFATALAMRGGATRCKMYTFNGKGFDLPVICQRAMRYGIDLSYYWDQGSKQKDTKWNNYVNRYQEAHTDLCDVLAHYGSGKPGLNDLAVFCGLPGKIGVGGSSVAEEFLAGNYEDIDNYCDVDVLITFLLGMKFSVTQGIARSDFQQSIRDVRAFLRKAQKVEGCNPLFEQFDDETDWELFGKTVEIKA